jgi:FMN phosphatase YigB (HAD superfamily)
MLTFVWDVDDVLNDLMRTWFTDVWLPGHPECQLKYADILQNPPHQALGISKSEYLDSLDTFRLSTKARAMPPNSGIMEWLRSHGARHRHMALTARPLDSAPYLSEWLFHHFGDYLRFFGVVPTRQEAGVPVYDTTKEEFLRWFGKADLLIDDSPENIAAAGRLGIRSVLFPQPWNGNKTTVDETLRQLAELAEAN